MVIHYTNIYNNVVFPGKKSCIFRFKGRKSCANGDSVTLEFMMCECVGVCDHVYMCRPTCFVHCSKNRLNNVLVHDN